MQAEVANEVERVDGPDEGIEAGESFADGHEANEFGGVDAQLGVVKDGQSDEDRGYHRNNGQSHVKTAHS